MKEYVYSYMQMAIIPRTPLGHGWLRPAIGVIELSQSIIQVFYYILKMPLHCSCYYSNSCWLCKLFSVSTPLCACGGSG